MRSVFCDVHAAAKNGLHLICRLRAANAARRLPGWILHKNSPWAAALAAVRGPSQVPVRMFSGSSRRGSPVSRFWGGIGRDMQKYRLSSATWSS